MRADEISSIAFGGDVIRAAISITEESGTSFEAGSNQPKAVGQPTS